MPDILTTSLRRGLSREIAAALLVKLVLLWGLWYLAFHHGKPASKPDIAEIFRPPQAQGLPLQSQENFYDIRR